MAADPGRVARPARANRDLLKDQAVRADMRIGMNHHAIRMRQQQAAANVRIQRNIRTRHHAPEPVTQHRPLFEHERPGPARCGMPLISANRRQQCLRWRPGAARLRLA
jgi:hypothetical protein